MHGQSSCRPGNASQTGQVNPHRKGARMDCQTFIAPASGRWRGGGAYTVSLVVGDARDTCPLRMSASEKKPRAASAWVVASSKPASGSLANRRILPKSARTNAPGSCGSAAICNILEGLTSLSRQIKQRTAIKSSAAQAQSNKCGRLRNCTPAHVRVDVSSRVQRHEGLQNMLDVINDLLMAE